MAAALPSTRIIARDGCTRTSLCQNPLPLLLVVVVVVIPATLA